MLLKILEGADQAWIIILISEKLQLDQLTVYSWLKMESKLMSQTTK